MKLTKCLLILFCLLMGCIRYTPATEDVESEEVSVSEEAFFSAEKAQRDKLASLLSERKTPSGLVDDNDYRIGGSDVLQFEVFDVEELSREVRVRPTGKISLPLVGTIEAKGLTESELQKAVVERLNKFMHSPQVTVRVSEYAAHKVFVIGEVATPGTYQLIRQDYSLVELISKAGGRTERASGRIILLPAVDGESDARAQLSEVPKKNKASGIEILWDDIAGTTGMAPRVIPLLPGDTIIVPEAGTVEVDGDIKTPGSYELSSRMTILGAIAAAGGLTYSSDEAVVEVIREVAGGEKVLVRRDLEMLSNGQQEDVRLRDGDVVRVPSATGRFAVRQVSEALERIFSFGLSATN